MENTPLHSWQAHVKALQPSDFDWRDFFLGPEKASGIGDLSLPGSCRSFALRPSRSPYAQQVRAGSESRTEGHESVTTACFEPSIAICFVYLPSRGCIPGASAARTCHISAIPCFSLHNGLIGAAYLGGYVLLLRLRMLPW